MNRFPYFPCITCGLCCKNSYLIPQLQTLLNEHNICKNFDEQTNKCKTYKSRPLICNVDEMYKQKYCYQMSKKDFYLANLKVCYKLNYQVNNENNLKRIKKLIDLINSSK